MTQQINLLIHQEDKQASIALHALVGLGVVLLVLLGYWGFEYFQTMQLRSTVKRNEQQLLAAQASLQAVQQKLAMSEKPGAVDTEIAALNQRSEVIQEVLERLKKDDMGRPEGYSGYLTALAKIPDRSVWLTSVSISNAGKNVHISGRALNNESIMRYAQRLNEQFSSYGVQFTSVEMVPEVFGREGGAVPPLSTVVFRLF